LQIEEFKASMKNFKNYKGKAGFFGRTNWRSKAMKEKAKQSKYLKEKIQRNNCKKKKKKKQEKRRIKKKRKVTMNR